MMEKNIMEIIKMIKKKDMEDLNGLMAKNILSITSKSQVLHTHSIRTRKRLSTLLVASKSSRIVSQRQKSSTMRITQSMRMTRIGRIIA